MYESYDFKFILIVIGTMGYVPKVIGTVGYVPKTLNRYLQDLTRILQCLSISGTVKISKTFLKFNKF